MTLSLKSVVLLLSAMLAAPLPLAAYEVSLITSSDGRKTILVKGEFVEDETPEKFLTLAKSSGAKLVSFDSEGGNIIAALELGRAIRAAGFDSYQVKDRECASACALIFVSGVNRSAENGAIGVHQSWFGEDSGLDVGEAVSAVQELTADMLTYLIEMGVDPRFLNVSLTTPSEDMHYLTTKEMADLKVTFGLNQVIAASPNVPAPSAPQAASDEIAEAEEADADEAVGAGETAQDEARLREFGPAERRNVTVRAQPAAPVKKSVVVRAIRRAD